MNYSRFLSWKIRSLACALAILFGVAASALAQSDGPYILKNPIGQWEALSVDTTPSGLKKHVTPIADTARISVPAVASVPAFQVKLRPEVADAPDVIHLDKRVPIFVVADSHGEYEILVTLLRAHHIVDASLHWHFGRGHLLVLGDVFDRGPNQTEIFWLLYELEGEAKKSGGAVHLLLGNHEVMELRGDARYLNDKYQGTTKILGMDKYAQLFSRQSLLGVWLRNKPAVLRINQYLFLHGGISRAISDENLSIQDINRSINDVLKDVPSSNEPDSHRRELLMGALGPLWYRGYFAEITSSPTATREDINLIQTQFGVEQILVGHTEVPTVTALYGGKVIAVQVYPHRDESTGKAVMEGVMLRNGKTYRATIDGRLESLLPD